MKTCYYASANYVELEGEVIYTEPIELGDKIIVPGSYVHKLGEKKRSSFEMQDGWYLKYIGYLVDHETKILLFDVNSPREDEREIYYGFYYVNKETLLIGSQKGVADIQVKHIEIFQHVKQKYLQKQMTLF